jgi:replicative DNA helicase
MNIDKKTRNFFANQHVERIVLSICMNYYEYFLEVNSQIKELDFLTDSHMALFSVIKDLEEEGVRVFDLHTIIARAEILVLIDTIGGYKYIAALKDMLVEPGNLESYIKELSERSSKWKLYKEIISAEKTIVNDIETNSGSTKFSDMATKVEKRIIDVSVETNDAEDAILLSEGLEEQLEEAVNRKAEILGLPSGIPELDRRINGFSPGALYVVAARPGAGKSTLLMNWALNLTAKLDVPILYLDTEMGKKEIGFRALSCLSGVPEISIKNGSYAASSKWRPLVEKAAGIINSSKYYHKYTPRFTIPEIRRLAKKYKAKYNIGCLFFDYIKMNDILLNLSETQYLGMLATTLKDLAGELDIPVITAAQMGRSLGQRGKATSENVGESDRILRYANILMSLVQKPLQEVEEAGGDDVCGGHRIQILKNRSGSTLHHGIDVRFSKHILTFEQASQQSLDTVLEMKGLDGGLTV